MNESLRPYESSGIDEALRIRLEGTIEVLEDDDTAKEAGSALICAEGVLFVPRARRSLMMKALTAEVLPVEVSLDEVLQLIGHLPPGRWGALTEHLEKAADVIWFPRGELSVEEKRRFERREAGGLMFVLDPKQRLEGDVLLARLK